jgi:hypothetical protein
MPPFSFRKSPILPISDAIGNGCKNFAAWFRATNRFAARQRFSKATGRWDHAVVAILATQPTGRDVSIVYAHETALCPAHLSDNEHSSDFPCDPDSAAIARTFCSGRCSKVGECHRSSVPMLPNSQHGFIPFVAARAVAFSQRFCARPESQENHAKMLPPEKEGGEAPKGACQPRCAHPLRDALAFRRLAAALPFGGIAANQLQLRAALPGTAT